MNELNFTLTEEQSFPNAIKVQYLSGKLAPTGVGSFWRLALPFVNARH